MEIGRRWTGVIGLDEGDVALGASHVESWEDGHQYIMCHIPVNNS